MSNMPIKDRCCCENSSLSNYVLTLSVDQGDRRHPGKIKAGMLKSFFDVMWNSLAANMKLKVRYPEYTCIGEDNCDREDTLSTSEGYHEYTKG